MNKIKIKNVFWVFLIVKHWIKLNYTVMHSFLTLFIFLDNNKNIIFYYILSSNILPFTIISRPKNLKLI